MQSKALYLVLFFVFLLWIVSPCYFIQTVQAATTLYVDDNASCPGNGTAQAPYCSISIALDNAVAGDTIYVYSGVYEENIEITFDITLTGQSKETTIIDGMLSGSVVSVQGSQGHEISFSLSGFTLRKAGGTGNDCLALSRVISGTITDNRIMNSDLSSGIQVDHCSDITISGNTISNNNVEHGIYLILSDNIHIENNVISSNSRGIYLYSSSNNAITNNDISENRYGIYVLSSSNNNQFYHNDLTNNDIENANDGGTNTWYSTSLFQGNYWDDYTGSDGNGDGIGDSEYAIPGGSNVDSYPLGYFVNQDPEAYIDSISPSPAVQDQTVTFNGHGTDDGTILAWEWVSSLDGSLSTAEDFSSSTLSVGTHTIKFRVQDNEEQWSTYATESLTITEQGSPENQEPIATILGITPNPATEGEIVTLTGQGSDSNGYITAYEWKEEDVVLGSSAMIETSSLSPGIHTISFRVKDNENAWSDEVLATLTIQEPTTADNQIPISNPGGPYSEYVNTTITFDGSLCSDPDGTIVNYTWDFGDGTIARGSPIEHVYTIPDNYTITLTVTDNNQSKVVGSTYIQVLSYSNGNHGNTSSEENGSSSSNLFNLPIVVVAPLLAISIFILVFIAFILWMKRT